VADAAGDVVALLRSPNYLVLLVLAVILGIPIAAAAYWFLYLVSDLQKWLFQPDYLLKALGFHGEPIWWPLPMVGLAGLLVGWTIRYLPGRGGHSPADGFHTAGAPPGIELPGIFFAALASLALGAVVGPEAPLIALGAGLAAGTVRRAKHDAGAQAVGVVGAAGSFAAVSALLGSPLSGAGPGHARPIESASGPGWVLTRSRPPEAPSARGSVSPRLLPRPGVGVRFDAEPSQRVIAGFEVEYDLLHGAGEGVRCLGFILKIDDQSVVSTDVHAPVVGECDRYRTRDIAFTDRRAIGKQGDVPSHSRSRLICFEEQAHAHIPGREFLLGCLPINPSTPP
jgi:hypothetical protein